MGKKSIYDYQENQVVRVSSLFSEKNGACSLGETTAQKYFFNAQNMTFWYEGEEDYPYHITKLTASELVIEDRAEDRDNDGKPDVLTRYFTRIK